MVEKESEFLPLALIPANTWGTSFSGLEEREPDQTLLDLLGIAASTQSTTLRYLRYPGKTSFQIVSGHCLNWVHSDSVRSLGCIRTSHDTEDPRVFTESDLDTWEQCLYLQSEDTADHACLHIWKLTNKKVSRFSVHTEVCKRSCIKLSFCVSVSPLMHQQNRFKSNFKYDWFLTGMGDLFNTFKAFDDLWRSIY